MNLFQQYPILATLLKPFRRSQQKTVAAVVIALTHAAQANTFAIAGELASSSHIQLASAINRIYRCLRNTLIDDLVITQQLLHVLANDGRVVLAIDWTEWHSSRSMLVAAVILGTRAIPVQASVVRKSEVARSQNYWEETFSRLTADCLKRAGVKAIWLCDRGFRRVAWIKHLASLKQDFVVRICDDVAFKNDHGKGGILKKIGLQGGEAVDLGQVWLRSDEAMWVRVIGVWARGSKQPWWIATNLTLPVDQIIALYDRRMGIEEQFRDSKGSRFGLKMKWTQFEKAEYLERMVLLVGIALMLWTSVGSSVVKARPKTQLLCKQKGARVSVLKIGIYYWREVTRRVKVGIRFIKKNIPAPRVRRFEWITDALRAKELFSTA